MTQDIEILCRMISPGPAFVLPECGVQHPMQTVFDLPMTSLCDQKAFSGHIFATVNEEMTLFRTGLPLLDLSTDHADPVQTSPLVTRGQPVDRFTGKTFSDFHSPMTLADLFGIVHAIVRVRAFCFKKQTNILI